MQIARLYAFGAIGKFFSVIGKILYKIINIFHLELAILVAILGLILEVAFHAVTAAPINKLIFYLLLTGAIVYAVIATVCSMLGIGKKKKASVAEIIEQPKVAEEKPIIEQPKVIEEKPKYYRVKQNKEYVMAEYSDRYELYKENNGKLEHIRTDYKQ